MVKEDRFREEIKKIINVKRCMFENESLEKKFDLLVNTEGQKALPGVVSYGLRSKTAKKIFLVSANFTDKEIIASINVKTYTKRGIPLSGLILVKNMTQSTQTAFSAKEVLSNSLKSKISVISKF